MSNIKQTFSIYVPLSKIEEQPDGTMLVWGRATQEVADSDGEICDYESSAPLFQRRSKMMQESSGGENLFPLRAMHQPIAAGKVTEMSYLPDDKAIDICAKVVDDNEIKKVRERVYTGFSVAGKYARRWRDPGTTFMRFTADPREISLVDVPAVPTARFTLFKLEEGEDMVVDTIENDPPSWVTEFNKSVQIMSDLHKAEKEEKDKSEEKLKAVGERVGISRRNGSPLSAPKDYPDDPDEYGDPANWAYPVDSSRASVAVGRFNGGIGADLYSPRSRHVLGRRIARLASRHGTEYKYDPATQKITRKKEGNTMPDTNVAKLDVGGLLAQVKAARDTAADLMAKDPEVAKDALGALVGSLDALVNAGQAVGGNAAPPAMDEGSPIKVADAPTAPVPVSAPAPVKAADVPPVASQSAPSSSDVGKPNPSDAKSSETEAYKAQIQQQAQKLDEMGKLLEKATKVMEKLNQQVDSPVGDLNSLVSTGNPLSALEDPIVKALMDGGPYAMQKALKLAGGDDEIMGSMAFNAVNNAIRKATYESLEKGGIVTAARYQGKIFTPNA